LKTTTKTFLKLNTKDSRSGGKVLAKINRGVDLEPTGGLVNGHYPITVYVYGGHLEGGKTHQGNKYNSFWTKALAFIEHGEGFRSKPYRDSVGVATIGFGSTFYLDGTRVKMSDPPISKAKARDLLYKVATRFERQIKTSYKGYMSLKKNQRIALLSFVYNVGINAFKKSTLLKRLKAQDLAAIPAQLKRWNKGRIKGKLVILKGLDNRRNSEIRMWKSGKF